MRRRKRIPLLFPLLSCSLLIYVVVTLPPFSTIPIGALSIPSYAVFLAVLWITITAIASVFLRTSRYAVFLGGAVSLIFLFKILKVTHPLLILLTVLLFAVLELLLRRSYEPS